jgi:hypothetical protein
MAKERGTSLDDEWELLGLRAKIMARRGLLDEAEKLARFALDRGSEPPVPLRATRVLQSPRSSRPWAAHKRRGKWTSNVWRYQAKGIVPLTENARALLAVIPA